ncbi:toll/interleukin-1 receptor domain-containing protein [Sphingopyxis sp.]|uniref:toll/interleukin-1 receptor domain-containing protein n=1 Tax=Sphingopyxis sp. TaxID=1908224 RepID=UPI003D6D217F
MTDVFISYKREERGRCVAIYNALIDLKLSVWFDAHIEPGTDFDREIEREVRGAGTVLVLWSALAADSDWIRRRAAADTGGDRCRAGPARDYFRLRSPPPAGGFGNDRRRAAALGGFGLLARPAG